MSLFDLKGKTAIVTGANRGLGKGIAVGLAKAGADIAIIARSKNEEVMSEIKGLGRKCNTYLLDLNNFSKYDVIVSNIEKDFGHIDILINNAGVQKRHPSTEFPVEDWDFVMNVNAKAAFFMCQAAGKIMIKQGRGKIVNMGSLLSFQGGYTIPAYAASKGAVMQFTKSLSNEWSSLGVNVNSIAPGYMLTEMNTAILNDETRYRQISERIPQGRWGKPEDLVGTAIYLSSNASDYVNGQIIAVDGGWMGR